MIRFVTVGVPLSAEQRLHRADHKGGCGAGQSLIFRMTRGCVGSAALSVRQRRDGRAGYLPRAADAPTTGGRRLSGHGPEMVMKADL